MPECVLRRVVTDVLCALAYMHEMVGAGRAKVVQKRKTSAWCYCVKVAGECGGCRPHMRPVGVWIACTGPPGPR